MRFFAPIFALLAATAVAQTSQFNVISNGDGALSPTAGSSETIVWTNPSSGTVTIKIQEANSPGITPDSGTILLENVPASAGEATVTIPADAVRPNVRYVYQIIDNTNSNGNTNANYSFPFLVTGAEGTTSTTSGTVTRTTNTATITSTSTGSSSSDESSSTQSGSSTVSGTRTTSTRTGTSSSTSGTASPTTAPGSASKLAAQGGLFAVMLGAAVVAL